MAKQKLAVRTRKSLGKLSRFIYQLQREQMSCGPITVQQCHTLEALIDRPKSMKDLSAHVALHQSTLTRIVEKLQKQGYVTRQRPDGNQRMVEVAITPEGRTLFEYLEGESMKLAEALLALVPKGKAGKVVESLEILAGILDPENEGFQSLLTGCCCKAPGTGVE